MFIKTFKYRLYPTPAQERQLLSALEVCRHWYNMCVAERKYAWQLESRRVSKAQQEHTGIQYRKTFPQAKIVFSQTIQSVCDDVDKAFQAFFRRVKAGDKPGYPRFKGKNWFKSFAFKQFGYGANLNGRRLKLFGIGRLRVRWHRPVEGRIKTVRILHSAGRWYACFVCEGPDADPLPPTGREVGIDVGVSALITTSQGEKVENPGYYRAAQKKLRVLQRALHRKQRGGQNRHKALLKVQRQHEQIARQRADFLDKLIHALMQSYDRIAVEDLRIANMVRNRHLSKSILDSGWGYFKTHLRVKAESAGRTMALVDPAYTSKTCSACGATFDHLTLSDRWLECRCGLSLDRDHNAAINILYRAGWGASVPDNVERRQARAFGRNPRR